MCTGIQKYVICSIQIERHLSYFMSQNWIIKLISKVPLPWLTLISQGSQAPGWQTAEHSCLPQLSSFWHTWTHLGADWPHFTVCLVLPQSQALVTEAWQGGHGPGWHRLQQENRNDSLTGILFCHHKKRKSLCDSKLCLPEMETNDVFKKKESSRLAVMKLEASQLTELLCFPGFCYLFI